MEIKRDDSTIIMLVIIWLFNFAVLCISSIQ